MNTVVHFDQICPENGRFAAIMDLQLGNPKRRKVAVALTLFLGKINRDTKNKHFEDLT